MLGSAIRDGGWEWNEPTARTSARLHTKAGRGNKGRMSRGKSGRSRISSSRGLLRTYAASKRLQGSNHQVGIAGA